MSLEPILDMLATIGKRAGLYALVLAFLFVVVPLFMAFCVVLLVVGGCYVAAREVFA